MMGHSLFLCFVFGSLIVNVLTMDDQMKELMEMLRQDCVQETGVDIDLIHKVNAGADMMPDAKLMCYCKCVMENGGVFSEGEVQVDVILELLPEDMKARNEASIRKCGTQKGKDDCETAFLTQACWQNANKKAISPTAGAHLPTNF